MEQKGKLVVISGFSGAGKGTLMKALLAAHPDRYAPVSYTHLTLPTIRLV